MADFDHSDFGGAYHAPVRSTLSTALNWVGAILSLGLIAGLGYWAYQLVVRDVTGVPVVRAMEGPMRIAPEDPGGVHGGLPGPGRQRHRGRRHGGGAGRDGRARPRRGEPDAGGPGDVRAPARCARGAHRRGRRAAAVGHRPRRRGGAGRGCERDARVAVGRAGGGDGGGAVDTEVAADPEVVAVEEVAAVGAPRRTRRSCPRARSPRRTRRA